MLTPGEKNRVWSLYSFQQPLFIPVGFDKSQESVSHNKEIEEGEVEKFGGGTVLLHLMSIVTWQLHHFAYR